MKHHNTALLSSKTIVSTESTGITGITGSTNGSIDAGIPLVYSEGQEGHENVSDWDGDSGNNVDNGIYIDTEDGLGPELGLGVTWGSVEAGLDMDTDTGVELRESSPSLHDLASSPSIYGSVGMNTGVDVDGGGYMDGYGGEYGTGSGTDTGTGSGYVYGIATHSMENATGIGSGVNIDMIDNDGNDGNATGGFGFTTDDYINHSDIDVDMDMEPDSLLQDEDEDNNNNSTGDGFDTDTDTVANTDHMDLFQLSGHTGIETHPNDGSNNADRYVTAVNNYYDEEERGVQQLESLSRQGDGGGQGYVSYSEAVEVSLRPSVIDKGMDRNRNRGNDDGYSSMSSAAQLRNQWYDPIDPDPITTTTTTAVHGNTNTSSATSNTLEPMENQSQAQYQSQYQSGSQSQPFINLMQDFHTLMSSVDGTGDGIAGTAGSLDVDVGVTKTIHKQDQYIQSVVNADSSSNSNSSGRRDGRMAEVSREQAAARLGAVIQLGLEDTTTNGYGYTTGSGGSRSPMVDPYSPGETHSNSQSPDHNSDPDHNPHSPNKGAAFEATIRSEMRKVSNMYVFGSPDGKPKPETDAEAEYQYQYQFDRDAYGDGDGDDLGLIADIETDSIGDTDTDRVSQTMTQSHTQSQSQPRSQSHYGSIQPTRSNEVELGPGSGLGLGHRSHRNANSDSTYPNTNNSNNTNSGNTSSSKQELFWKSLNEHCARGSGNGSGGANGNSNDLDMDMDVDPNPNHDTDYNNIDVGDITDKVDVLVTTNDALMKTVQSLQLSKKEYIKRVELLESTLVETNIQRGIDCDNYKVKLQVDMYRVCI